MKINRIKDKIRVIGIDDAPFIPHTKGDALIFGVITRGNFRIEGVEQTMIKIDGMDATEKISKMIMTSNHYDQIRVILLYGITFGGLVSFAKPELEKGGALCQEEMEQGQPTRDLEKVAIVAQAEAEWAARLRQDRVESAYV